MEKGRSFYKVAKSWVELCSSVLWKAEFMSDETGYLTWEISEQIMKDRLGFSLLLIVKCKRYINRKIAGL